MSDVLARISVMQLVYSLKIGGSEKLAYTISTNLNQAMFWPSVCALDLGGELVEDLENSRIEYHVLHRQGLEANIFRRLYCLIKRNRIDVVHTHHFTQLFYAAIPARLAGARIIHTEHEFFSYLTDAFSRTMIRSLLRFCDGMTVVGQEVSDYFVRTVGIPEGRVMVVPNSVDITKFDCDRNLIRGKLGLRPHEVVIGTVGRLEPEKDQKTLLEAFRQIKEVHPAARLLIVGDGSMAEELKCHAKRIGISDQTLFLGNRRDVPSLLAAMDIFVLSSIREGLPISLIEAMAARKPVVASDIGSIRDLVHDGQNGFLTPSGDPARFSRFLLRLIESTELRERLGSMGYQIVERSFSLPAMIRAYEELYRSAYRKRHVRN